MDVLKNKIQVNKKYYILQVKNNNVCFNYLKDVKEDRTIIHSANEYSFINKAQCFCKLNKNIKNNIINFVKSEVLSDAI